MTTIDSASRTRRWLTAVTAASLVCAIGVVPVLHGAWLEPAAAAVADPPTDVAGSPGDAQVFLSWVTPVVDGGSAVTGYRVQVSTSAGGPYANAAGGCAPATVGIATTVRCDATGLTNGVSYYFKVAAINGSGTSSYSTASAAVIPAAATNRVVTLNSGGGTSASDGLKFQFGSGNYQVTRYNSATTPPASSGQLYGETSQPTAPFASNRLFNGTFLRVGTTLVGPCIPTTRVAVTAASGDGTTVTYTTASAHTLSVGRAVLVDGIDPTGYDTPGTGAATGAVVTAVPSPTQFTVASSFTGAYVSGGAATTGAGVPAQCANAQASTPMTSTGSWTSVVSSGGSANAIAGGTGTALSTLTYVDPTSSLTYTVVLRFDYTAGDPFITQTSTVTVPAGNATACSGAPCEIKLYLAMDTFLGGSDQGAGFRTLDTSGNMLLIGVRSTAGTTEALRWRSGDRWTGYVSGFYNCPFRASACMTPRIPSTGAGSMGAGGDFWTGTAAIDPSPTTDNGIGVMWDTSNSPGTSSYATDVLFAVAPVVSTTSLPATTTCPVYSQTLTATSGSGTYTDWALSSGSLPAGLTLNAATGVISGTPTAVGTSTFDVVVTDSNYFTSNAQTLSIVVTQGMPIVSTTSLAGGVVGTAYAQTLAAACGTGTYTSWAITSGTLPAGLTLNTATGVISGTPTTVQVAPITVEVTDTGANTATKALSITITAAPVPAPPAPATPATPAAAVPAPPCTLATQDPITNPVNGNIPPGGLGAGATVTLNGCAAVPTTLTPDGRSLTISATGNMWRVEGRGAVNDALGLVGNSVVQLISGPAGTTEIRSRALISGTGALPGSTVKAYLLPATALGEVPVDAAGTFNGSVAIPAGLAPGTYTLQANALGPDRQTRSLSIGVLMKSAKAITIPSGSITVRFQKDSAKITPKAKRQLKAVANRIDTPRARSVIIGYVQKDSTKHDNKKLSRARAKNTARYLRKIGIRGIFVAKGKGIDPRKTGRNGRRVDVTIVGLPR